MSRQGKAIAMARLTVELAGKMLVTLKKVAPLHRLTQGAILVSTKACIDMQIRAAQCTPHQYFNANGKIDKRKVRRHRRKRGMKPHATRLIRAKG